MRTLNRAVNPHTGIRTNDVTLYELAAEHPDGRRLLVAYFHRRTRSALYHALQNRMEHVQRVFGTLAIDWEKKARDGARMGSWRLFWTGRTQRDACGSGELTYIGDVAEGAAR